MRVAMVKHTKSGKTYWFKVPEWLEQEVTVGARVMCHTSRGYNGGVVVGIMDEEEAKPFMGFAGVSSKLKQIMGFSKGIPMDQIKVPGYLTRCTVSDEKIAKRFLEYYHDGAFSTNVQIDDDGYIADGYSAYLVAKFLGLPELTIVSKGA